MIQVGQPLNFLISFALRDRHISRSEMAEALKKVQLFTTQENFDVLFAKLDKVRGRRINGGGTVDLESISS